MTARYPTDTKLSSKLTRFSVGVIAIALFLMTAVYTIYSHKQAEENLISDLNVLSDVLGNRSSAALVFNDKAAAQRHLSSTGFRDSLVKACLYNSSGSLFASYLAEPRTQACQQTISPDAAEVYRKANHLGVTRTLRDSGQKIGTVQIEASTDRINKTIAKALFTSLIALAIILTLAFVLMSRLITSALGPLTNLHDIALTISKDPFSKLRARRVRNDEVGRLVGVFNKMLDTLDRENNALLKSESRFRTLAQHSPVGIYQLDAERQFIYTNQKWHDLTGLHGAQNRNEYLAMVDEKDREHYRGLFDTVYRTHQAQVVEYQYQCPKSGRKLNLLEHIAPVLGHIDEEITVEGFIGSLLDISDLKNAQMELESLAFYDPLTNLPNRRYFKDHLQYILAAAQHEKRCIAVLMVDLDNFKKVNDTMGHDAGDELLSALSERFKGSISKQDVVARMGGDEFMILLRDVSGQADIQRIAERILGVVRQPIRIRDYDIEVSASIGVSVYPEDANTAEELMRNADLALYLSKDSGRNRVSFFSRKLESQVSEKVYLERKLREAIKADKLCFYVQPQWSLHDGQLSSGEVLLRWFDDEDGPISPAKFIPVAEEAGLILEMGDWLIDKVFESIAHNREKLEALGIKSLAINLSARQFFNNKLALKIDSALRTYDIDPAMIELELTESAVMEDIELAVEIMERLKRIGCRLSIDDFGTGYSSLSYLKRFPIDAVKVDRSFISDIPQDQNDIEISSAIIAMGHSLGLEVVAEGVETQEQMDFLVNRNCDYAQGFMIAKPIPFEELFDNVPKVNTAMSKINSVLGPLSPPGLH